jgi:diaminopimelate decarboxylase
MVFHGNNKSRSELEEAMRAKVGLIAVDNLHEIELLQEVALRFEWHPDVVLRLNPGVDPHTHHKMRTGATDSKFGFPVWDGQAAAAAKRVVTSPALRLAGYHAHVGSQIFDPTLVEQTLTEMMQFATEVFRQHEVAPRVVIPGGGFGVADDASGADVSIAEWAATAARTIREQAAIGGYDAPELVVEPGRAIVGPAGVAIYEVGARKEIPDARTYVSVDGGMSDNIRPSLYGARYSADLVNRDGADGPHETVTIAGKYCESGDVLIDGISLPALAPGDLLALPMAGAYCLAMASNYNLAPRPAVVLVNEGRCRLIRRRESYADMLRNEVFEAGAV